MRQLFDELHGATTLRAADELGARLVEGVVAGRRLRQRVLGDGWNTQGIFDQLELLSLLGAKEAEAADLLEPMRQDML